MVWPVSDRLKQAIAAGPAFRLLATCTPPGGAATEIRVKSGSLLVNGSQRVRRTVNGFQVYGDSDAFELIATPGALFRISYGVSFGSSDELVPVFTGEAQRPDQAFGDGGIGATLVDLTAWLSRAKFSSPFIAAAGSLRTTVITNVVQTARPGTEVVNLSTDLSTLPAQQMWSDGPADVIADLTADGGTEGFFRPDGVFLIRDRASLLSPAVWTFAAGEGGTLTGAARNRPNDRFINRVVVRPAARDGSQTWTEQTAQVTDPLHPLHYLKIGDAPLTIDNTTAGTGAEAATIARNTLDRSLGLTETLSFSAITFPAAEANEPYGVVTPQLNGQPAKTFQHYLDSFSIDFGAGVMSGQTRSQVVLDG